MRCSQGQLRNNGACCARANVRVRFQLRTALKDSLAARMRGSLHSGLFFCHGLKE